MALLEDADCPWDSVVNCPVVIFGAVSSRFVAFVVAVLVTVMMPVVVVVLDPLIAAPRLIVNVDPDTVEIFVSVLATIVDPVSVL